MFDIGWTEMLVIAVVMIVVVGPKDLPKMLRTFGKMTAKMRGMASDFQKQFNEALKEAELDEVKKSVDSLRDMNPATQVKKALNPFEKAAADVRAGIQTAMAPKPATTSTTETASTAAAAAAVAKPSDALEPASATVHEAEPLKNGASVLAEAAPNGAAAAATATAAASAGVNGTASLSTNSEAPVAASAAVAPAAAVKAPAPAGKAKAPAAPRKRASSGTATSSTTTATKSAKTTTEKAASKPAEFKPRARKTAAAAPKATDTSQ